MSHFFVSQCRKSGVSQNCDIGQDSITTAVSIPFFESVFDVLQKCGRYVSRKFWFWCFKKIVFAQEEYLEDFGSLVFRKFLVCRKRLSIFLQYFLVPVAKDVIEVPFCVLEGNFGF